MLLDTAMRWLLLGQISAAAGGADPGAAGAEAELSLQGGAVEAEAEATPPVAALTPEGERSSGFEHGLRLGVSLPVGQTDEGNPLRSGDLSGVVALRVPIWLDIGYRLNPSWWVGLAPELGLGPEGSDCDDDHRCEWSDLRLSAQAIYSISPNSSSDPWIGAGLGWESLRGSVTLTATDPSSDQEVALRLREVLQGPQIFAQGGMRFDLGESLKVGPYLSASAGMFLLDEFDCPEAAGCPADGIEEHKLHAWFGLGVRGTHGP